MDANGQHFWLLADGGHWRWRSHAHYDRQCRALELASERVLPAQADPSAVHAAANSALEATPRALDDLGAVAFWSASAGAILARSELPGEAVRMVLPQAPSDLLVAADGVLYVLLAGAVRMHDLRGRFPDVTVAAPGFTAWRAAADPAGGVWLLERASGRLGKLSGRPLRDGPLVNYDGRVFRPDPENCHPPRIDLFAAPDWPLGERPIALACDDQGPVLLSWVGGDGRCALRRYDPGSQRLGPRHELLGARYAYALALIDAERVALRVPGLNDAPCWRWPETGSGEALQLPVSGEVFPLASEALAAPFAHRLHGPPHYPVALLEGNRGTEPLHALSLANLAPLGEARHYDDDGAHLIDSGAPHTVWHRLYAEARIPARCGFVVWLAATAEPQAPPANNAEAWLPHRFGATPRLAETQAAQAVWESQPSELAHHPGLAPWPAERGRAGLFSVLVQNPGQRVRRLVGRYLWVRVVLHGDRRSGPQIAALRAWSSRFSYRDAYLPRLYRESDYGEAARAPGERLLTLGLEHIAALDGGGAPAPALLEQLSDADLSPGSQPALEVLAPGSRWLLRDPVGGQAWPLRREDGDIALYRPQATPADFLERVLANFEGVLTPIEDRIASAHHLSDPAAAPEESLDWLGGWIGVAFDPALPAARRREWLAAAPELARFHGTRRGLVRALDIATGGSVSGGEIVVVEDFRLRRTLSTLIGVDLNDAHDPLLPGLIVSGNSVVGDSLFVGDTEKAELLALFRADIGNSAEEAAVLAFDARLAHRATVLVHSEVTAQDLGLIRRIVELESPAHAEVRVVTASVPFLVGVASLVGVDSYLGAKPPRQPVRASRSLLGGGDFLIAPASVDPRLGAAAPAVEYPPPVARIAGPETAPQFGNSFELDGSDSSAAPGREILSYRWQYLPPSS